MTFEEVIKWHQENAIECLNDNEPDQAKFHLECANALLKVAFK